MLTKSIERLISIMASGCWSQLIKVSVYLLTRRLHVHDVYQIVSPHITKHAHDSEDSTISRNSSEDAAKLQQKNLTTKIKFEIYNQMKEIQINTKKTIKFCRVRFERYNAPNLKQC